MNDVVEGFESLLDRPVVLDTGGPILYVGILRAVTRAGFWLEGADVRDRRDGHAPHELYLLETRSRGIRVNRRRVFVLRESVMSASALDDVIEE